MTTPPNANMPAWNVTGVQPGQYETDAAGNPVEGHIVYFQLSDGTMGQVFVPNTQWNLGAAQPIIEQAVNRMVNIRYLSGGGS